MNTAINGISLNLTNGERFRPDRRKKMKRLMIVLAVLFIFSISALAQINTAHGGGMMDGGWGWEMGHGWGFGIIIVIVVILGVVFMMKRR